MANPTDLGASGIIPTIAIAGVPGIYDYSGGGPVVQSPVDGSLLQIVHVERNVTGTPAQMWSNLGVARSTDQGTHWSWLGVIIEPFVRFVSGGVPSAEITGGPLVYSRDGQYLYCYFRDTYSDYTGRPAVARALASSVFAAASGGAVTAWNKWDGVGWSQPGVGGGLGFPLAGLPAEVDWCSVVYQAQARCYLMAYSPYPVYRIRLATSVDGLHWQAAPGVITDEAKTNFYPTLVCQGGNDFYGTGPVHLYYVNTQGTNTPDWATGQVQHRVLTLQTGGRPCSRNQRRQGGPSAATAR
jgi:hypothetical protein